MCITAASQEVPLSCYHHDLLKLVTMNARVHLSKRKELTYYEVETGRANRKRKSGSRIMVSGKDDDNSG